MPVEPGWSPWSDEGADLAGQRLDTPGELAVGAGQRGVLLQELAQLLRRPLELALMLLRSTGAVHTMLLDGVGGGLVAVGLPCLGEQDERSRVGGLQGEGEVEEDERVGIPVLDDRDGVEDDPDDDGDGLTDDVLGRAEESRCAFCVAAEGVAAERAGMAFPVRLSHEREGRTSAGCVAPTARPSRAAKATTSGASNTTEPSITAYPAAIADGGLPDGKCDHGATAAQLQSPAHVPAISIVAVSSQMAAYISPRPERRMHHASSGSRIAPCTS